MTPYELGYAGFVKFDHDFIGREALETMEGKHHRKKVTFAWNNEDVTRILASMFAPPGENYKFIDLPLSNYASASFDTVMNGGKMVGVSMFSGYSYNERTMLSLGFVEEQYAKPGTRGDAGVGRGERRHQEDHGRAPQADRGQGGGRPDALRRAGARGLPPSGLARRGNRLTPIRLDAETAGQQPRRFPFRNPKWNQEPVAAWRFGIMACAISTA